MTKNQNTWRHARNDHISNKCRSGIINENNNIRKKKSTILLKVQKVNNIKNHIC